MCNILASTFFGELREPKVKLFRDPARGSTGSPLGAWETAGELGLGRGSRLAIQLLLDRLEC